MSSDGPVVAGRKPLSRRALVAASIGIALWLYGTRLVLAFYGTPSELGGWWPSSWPYLPATLGFGLVLRRGMVPAVVIGAALALMLGCFSYATAPPGSDRLRAAVEDVPPPDSWTLVSEEVHGNDWCWGGCPTLRRVYATDDSPREVAVWFDETMQVAGWRRERSAPRASISRFRTQEWTRRRVNVDVSILGGVARDQPPMVPSSQTKVEVWVGSE